MNQVIELPQPDDLQAERVRRLEGRLDRERRARIEAERLLEEKSLALYDANLALAALAAGLEQRVKDRTQELTAARQLALTQAETDALTGIANRGAFTRRLNETLANAEATTEGVALLLIDLDDFKSVNDNLGHAAGDAMLIAVAQRLSEVVRPGDTVARLGGDEFAVVAHGVGFDQHGQQMAQRLHDAVCQPLIFERRSIGCQCSIGIAHADPVGIHADLLLGNADLALYAAKHAGRGRVCSFEAGLRAEVEKKARLEGEVRHAVLADQIEPWYQPIRDCRSGRFTSVEMLARWHLPDGEVRSPGEFLGAVEALGLLDTMMENMLRRAMSEALPLVNSGALGYLSINVSPTQFNYGWAQNALPRLQAQTGFPAHALVVELTETALLDDIAIVRGMLGVLTDSGIRIALDDFGMGYSNFSLLRQLRFNFLKLDRSLSNDIETDAHSRAVTECVLALASRLGVDVIAEGVETQRQSDLLLAAGCSAQQGFFHARPQRDLRAALSAGVVPGR